MEAAIFRRGLKCGSPECTKQGHTRRLQIDLTQLPDKPYAVFVMPAAFTPVCGNTIALASARLYDFIELDAQVFGMTTDNIASIDAWVETLQAGIPVFSDFTDRDIVKSLTGLNEDGTGMRGVAVIHKGECVEVLSGEDLTPERQLDFALEVIRGIRDDDAA